MATMAAGRGATGVGTDHGDEADTALTHHGSGGLTAGVHQLPTPPTPWQRVINSHGATITIIHTTGPTESV
jgi:hypothetical protein